MDFRALLIEDEDDMAKVVAGRLTSAGGPPVLERVGCLKDGLERLSRGDVGLVLLDLNLPDSQGLNTFLKVRAHAPEMPIVILTALDDETIGLSAVRQGAQDYLIKGSIEGPMLRRVIQYAVERHRLRKEIQELALVDELTGLHNRRGFLVLAEQQLRLAQRTKKGLLLVCADVDGLKGINDTLGHAAGDLALTQAAAVLQRTFRRSDILARVGGDEFVVLAIEAREDSPSILRARFQRNLQELQAQAARSFSLSVSMGMKYIDPTQPASLPALMAEADRALYDQKRAKRAS